MLLYGASVSIIYYVMALHDKISTILNASGSLIYFLNGSSGEYI